MYLCEMIFAIFCLYLIHIDIGYECIVFSCIVEINFLTLLTLMQPSTIAGEDSDAIPG